MDSTITFRRTLLRQLLFATGMSAAVLGAPACATNEVCFEVDPAQACPSRANAQVPIELQLACTEELESVDSDGERDGADCCYQVTTNDDGQCVIEGRPLISSDTVLLAPATDCADWSQRNPSSQPQATPDMGALNEDQRAQLAAMWTRSALAEHASVASFSRFALELMAVAAPPALVAEAQRAALDEVAHAQAGFGLASAYADAPVGPGPLPLPTSLTLRTKLAELAHATAIEACVNETLAVMVAAEQLAQATEPAVRAVLTKVVADESRHAALAWRTLAWSIERGGKRLRDQLATAIRNAAPVPSVADDRDSENTNTTALRAHGWLDEKSRAEAMQRGFAEVVLPCLETLLRSDRNARDIATPSGGLAQRY